ncbi:MAG: hypothetical protein LAP87_26740 [Acidobacteriia bacterium]|nr:hypothetical protein [Terriglobia bacterium]
MWRGGVSPRIGAPATRDPGVIVQPAGPAPTAAAFPGFAYHGGPVVKVPQIYATFWGSLWLSDAAHLTRAARLSQYLTDLVASQYMNVLSQYGSGSGAGTGCYMRAAFLNNPPTNLTDPQIKGILQDCINSGVLPEPANPSNTCVINFLADDIGINDPGDGLVLCEAKNDTAFGYHEFFTTTAGHSMYYAMIPGLTGACLKESCANDGTCSLHLAETQEQRQTQVTSHEFAEMITDPQLNAWYDAGSGSENGDICNGSAATITAGVNTWTVQRQYSKADDIASNGANFCVVTAPSPMAKLVPGPAATLTPVARRQQLEAIAKMLPLPEVHYDVKAKKAKIEDQHIQEFAQRLLNPFHHSDLVPDLPGLLHQFADVIAKTKKN